MLRPAQNRRLLGQNGPFFARSSSSSSSSKRNYINPTNLADIRRKWAKFGPFYPKKLGPFFWLSPLKKRVLAPRVWKFRRGSFKNGNSFRHEQPPSNYFTTHPAGDRRYFLFKAVI